VHSGQSETGNFEVVELSVEPTVHGVAGIAGGWEAERDVVENRGQEVLLVAGIASRRESLELPCSGVFVTCIALHDGMSPHEGEAVLVILDRIEGDIPTPDRVAAFTIGAKLPAMNVGVAVGAMGTYVFENEAGVALCAAYLLMHATEGIASGVVIELGNRANGLPTGIGVAVLARDGQRTVGISDLGLGLGGIIPLGTGRCLLRGHAKQQRQNSQTNRNEPTPPGLDLFHLLPPCESGRGDFHRRMRLVLIGPNSNAPGSYR